MIKFLFGMFIGSLITVIILSFCFAASEDDDEELWKDK